MSSKKMPFLKDANGTYCTKRKFDSERDAKKALKSARRVGCCKYYECFRCGKWHLTSQRRKNG